MTSVLTCSQTNSILLSELGSISQNKKLKMSASSSSTEKKEEEIPLELRSHFYLSEEVPEKVAFAKSMSDLPVGETPNTMIKKVQQSILFYLYRDETDDNTQSLEQAQIDRIRYSENIIQQGEEKIIKFVFDREVLDDSDYFTIRIPSKKLTLLALKKIITLESKVFETMLNSEMVESTSNEMTFEGENCTSFERMIRFIHSGSLGTPKPGYVSSSQTKDVLNLQDLIELLEIGDEYQVFSLIRAISRTLNEYTASVLAMRSLEMSEDSQEIIISKASDIIARNICCLSADLIYDDLLDTVTPELDIETIPPGDLESALRAVQEKFPYVDLKPTEIKSIGPFLLYLITDSKVLCRLPVHFFRKILKSPYFTLGGDNSLMLVVLWMLQDKENRIIDGLELIRSPHFPILSCTKEALYHFLYNTFLRFCVTPDIAKESNEFKEFLLKALFKIDGHISQEEWDSQFSSEENVEKVVTKKELRACLFGLDASGKTTALYKWKLGEVVTTIPTIGFNVETVDYKNHKITMVSITRNIYSLIIYCSGMWVVVTR